MVERVKCRDGKVRSFAVGRSDQRYCSNACRQRAYRCAQRQKIRRTDLPTGTVIRGPNTPGVPQSHTQLAKIGDREARKG